MTLWKKIANWFNEPVDQSSRNVAPYKIDELTTIVNNTKDIAAAFENSAFYTNTSRQLYDEEGCVGYAYQDHLGYWTIGIGRLIDKRKGGSISKEEALYLLDNDIKVRVEQLTKKLPWWVELDPARKSVLLQMSFQMGIIGLLKFKTTLRNVKEGNYEAAATGMVTSLWAKQTPQRAHRMAMQMLTGDWQYID